MDDCTYYAVRSPDTADWIKDRLRTSHTPGVFDLGSLIPSGFDSLVRVLHPFTRHVPVTGRVRTELIEQENSRIPVKHQNEYEEVRWSETSEKFGTEFRPAMSAFDVLGLREESVEAADGWIYDVPLEGTLQASYLSRISNVLKLHTRKRSKGVAAVWDGLTSSFDPSRLSSSDVLEVANLPDRSYVCFAASVLDFCSQRWIAKAPWTRLTPGPAAEYVQTPHLLWPQDRAWLLVTDVGLSSTLIACTESCALDLLHTPGIETVVITRDTTLSL